MNFNKLIFDEYENTVESYIFFPNGYGLRICGGYPYQGDGEETFEVYLLQGPADNWELLRFSKLADISVPYATKQDIENIITEVQEYETVSY